MTSDRRESLRVTPERPLHARAVGVDADFKLLDVSLGGFLVEGPVAFGRRASHRFRITDPTGGRVIELEAQAVRCRLRSSVPVPTYQTGFAFLNHRHPATAAKVRVLIESLTVQPVD